jgi:hypothetical protein
MLPDTRVSHLYHSITKLKGREEGYNFGEFR